MGGGRGPALILKGRGEGGNPRGDGRVGRVTRFFEMGVKH